MTIAPIPSVPYYTRILKTYFSWTTEDDRMTYWQRFAVSKGFSTSSPPEDSPALQSEFEAFLAKYKKWGLTTSSLRLGNSIPTTNTYYSTLLDTFFSEETATTKKDIWNGFVESQGYTTNPTDTATIRQAFNSYIRVIHSESISKKINDYFSQQPLSFRIMLWDHFARSKGSTGLSLSESDQNMAEFLVFIQRYSALGIGPDSFSLNQSIPTSPPFYQNFMSAYFGNLTTIEQTDIWNNFLSHYGYSTNPTDSESVQKQFATYIQGLSSRLYSLQDATLLSPKEMESRVIATSVLSSLKKYLNATEQQIQTQSNSLMFYGRWQQYYTDMMTRVPNLTGGEAGKVKANTTDLSKFTFGYNNISMLDAINWGVDEALKHPSVTAAFGSPEQSGECVIGKYSFLVQEINGKKEIRLGIDLSTAHIVTFNGNIPSVTTLPPISASKTIVFEDPSASPAIKLSTSELVDAVQNGFKALFQETPDFIQRINNKIGIPGRYLGSTDSATNDKDIQGRAEVNALLQQYVENIRSQRDAIRNLSSQLQSSLNQSRQGINNQTSLWTSILETIDNVMKEITRKG